ncbi:MAG: hypothetical protein DLM68_10940 [Hyphomicrobiales bacterium]|nr:MAG: hypothetical protein DLM68_10940 [Hyphomicrobiales bacterium]
MLRFGGCAAAAPTAVSPGFEPRGIKIQRSVLRRASFVRQGLRQDAAERINRVTVARQATASLKRLFDGMILLTNAR